MNIENEKIYNEIEKHIKKLAQEYNNLSPIMPQIVAIINNDIQRNLDAGGRWNGDTTNIDIFSSGTVKWQDLAKSTKKNYERLGYELSPTLYRTGRLLQQTEVTSKGNKIYIVSNMPYARIHQQGGWVNVPAHTRSIKFKTSKIKISDKKVKKTLFAKKNAKGSNISSKEIKVQSYKFYIPPRPFIVIQLSSMKRIKDLIKDYLSK